MSFPFGNMFGTVVEDVNVPEGAVYLLGMRYKSIPVGGVEQHKMKEDFDKQFPEPLKYKNGVDMSGETFHALGASLGFPTMISENGGQSWIDPHFNPIIGIEIHIVPGMPFGAVEECRCEERYKLKFQVHDPLPPQDMPSMVEFTQEMPIEEAKKRWPNTQVLGEEK